jgi:hypothetical protein
VREHDTTRQQRHPFSPCRRSLLSPHRRETHFLHAPSPCGFPPFPPLLCLSFSRFCFHSPGGDQSFWVLTLSQRAILFLIARLGYMSPHEIEKLVPWLQENLRHPISYYVLCSLLAAFDLVDPQTPGGVPRQRLATFPSTVNLLKKNWTRQSGKKLVSGLPCN